MFDQEKINSIFEILGKYNNVLFPKLLSKALILKFIVYFAGCVLAAILVALIYVYQHTGQIVSAYFAGDSLITFFRITSYFFIYLVHLIVLVLVVRMMCLRSKFRDTFLLAFVKREMPSDASFCMKELFQYDMLELRQVLEMIKFNLNKLTRRRYFIMVVVFGTISGVFNLIAYEMGYKKAIIIFNFLENFRSGSDFTFVLSMLPLVAVAIFFSNENDYNKLSKYKILIKNVLEYKKDDKKEHARRLEISLPANFVLY